MLLTMGPLSLLVPRLVFLCLSYALPMAFLCLSYCSPYPSPMPRPLPFRSVPFSVCPIPFDSRCCVRCSILRSLSSVRGSLAQRVCACARVSPLETCACARSFQRRFPRAKRTRIRPSRTRSLCSALRSPSPNRRSFVEHPSYARVCERARVSVRAASVSSRAVERGARRCVV